MKIDLETAKYYTGLGDFVLLAWLAAGVKASADPLTFHRTRDLALLNMLGLQVDPEPGGLLLDPAYHSELADRCVRA
jgi:hypothetical protein